ncbi:TonB-dependent receptor [Reichenbachiella sp. MALMAid0571]
MRITLLLMFLAIMQVSANSYAQKTKLRINLKNVEISELLEEIERLSEFDFLYKSELLKDRPKVTVEAGKASIKTIMKSIMPKDLKYEVFEKTIIIKKKTQLELEASAQEEADVSITGKVTDENGSSLPGASVVVQGTTTGTTSDLDGNYKLSVPDDAILEISFVGYKTQVVVVGSRTVIDVSMQEDLATLGEVLVVGYGTVERKDATGAISSVKGEDFKNLPVSGIDKALQGRMSGVQVVRNGGAPGASTSIRIRGTGTVNNSEPLYIVDGIPTSSIDGINPNNIESIEVLKDASASAIYGTRAANGVVILTTRKGAEDGSLKFNIDMYSGVTDVTKTLDVLDAPTLAEIKRERYANDGIPVNPIWQDSQYQTQKTNWQDELFKTGKTQNIDISISGGNEKSTFLVAMGYYNEQGVIDKAKADRYTLRINSNHKVTKWLKVGQNLALSTRSSNQFDTNSAQSGLIWSAIRFHPGLPVQDADGNYSTNQVSGEFGDINNPIYEVSINDSDNRKTRMLSNVTTEISLTKDLKFKTNFAVDGTISDSRYFNPLILNQIRQRTTNSAGRSYAQDFSLLMEYFLAYNKTFGDNTIGFVGGYTQQSFDYQGFSATATNFPDEDSSQRFLSTGSANSTTEYRAHDGLRSVFGRANYSFMDKYLLTVTVRSDESSKFADGHRRGVFPAFSLGWRVSDEDFFNVPFISDMKVTGGWGALGNQNIDRLQYLARISRGQRYSFGYDGSNQVVGANQSSFANENITWETVKMSNIGVNLGFLDNRLTSNFNYFIKDTEDMLLSPPTIGAQGNNPSPYLNIGQVRNKGLEIELNWRNTKGEFSYNIGGNASFISNEVTKLVDGTFLASRFYGRPDQEISRTYENNPIGTFYGWKTDGLFQTQSDIDNHAEQPGAVPGDVRFVDINDDNVIDDQDRTILGSPHPKMSYGINANMSYKGFDVTLFFMGVAGVDIYNADRMQGIDASYPFNLYSEVTNRWTGPGTSNEIPRVSTLRTNLNYRTSDMFIESGDFLRLKNLTIGYTLSSDVTDKVGLSRLRFYFTGQNVFTITGYSGLDPELGLTDGTTQLNVDYAQFPQARTFMLGVNIGF